MGSTSLDLEIHLKRAAAKEKTPRCFCKRQNILMLDAYHYFPLDAQLKCNWISSQGLQVQCLGGFFYDVKLMIDFRFPA